MSGFIDIDFAQVYKDGEMIGGDVYKMARREEDGRIIGTLSDGLGSGVKANVLASLTATMAQKYLQGNIDIKRSASIIMDTLPVCTERKISYSTFTLMDIQKNGFVNIVEYDNPDCILFRSDEEERLERDSFHLPKRIAYKEDMLHCSNCKLSIGDRLIFFSDGVSQSGMGSRAYPLGWRREEVTKYVQSMIKENSAISSRELSRKIVRRALLNDENAARDDISCGVVYYRKPRTTLLVTGPPIEKERDALIIEHINSFDGAVVISGGTTASIVARGLGRKVEIDIKSRSHEVPPLGKIDGIDLVTEGMLTLSYCATLLEQKANEKIQNENNAASHLARILLDSDHVQFLVGTKINEAHQNPDMPIDLGIRRSLIKRIIHSLETNYVKETSLEYI